MFSGRPFVNCGKQASSRSKWSSFSLISSLKGGTTLLGEANSGDEPGDEPDDEPGDESDDESGVALRGDETGFTLIGDLSADRGEEGMITGLEAPAASEKGASHLQLALQDPPSHSSPSLRALFPQVVTTIAKKLRQKP